MDPALADPFDNTPGSKDWISAKEKLPPMSVTGLWICAKVVTEGNCVFEGKPVVCNNKLNAKGKPLLTGRNGRFKGTRPSEYLPIMDAMAFALESLLVSLAPNASKTQRGLIAGKAYNYFWEAYGYETRGSAAIKDRIERFDKSECAYCAVERKCFSNFAPVKMKLSKEECAGMFLAACGDTSWFKELVAQTLKIVVNVDREFRPWSSGALKTSVASLFQRLALNNGQQRLLKREDAQAIAPTNIEGPNPNNEQPKQLEERMEVEQKFDTSLQPKIEMLNRNYGQQSVGMMSKDDGRVMLDSFPQQGFEDPSHHFRHGFMPTGDGDAKVVSGSQSLLKELDPLEHLPRSAQKLMEEERPDFDQDQDQFRHRFMAAGDGDGNVVSGYESLSKELHPLEPFPRSAEKLMEEERGDFEEDQDMNDAFSATVLLRYDSASYQFMAGNR